MAICSIVDNLKNPLARYGPMGFNDTATPGYVYVFYEDKDGNWVIKKTTTNTGTNSYAVGSSGSAAAFANPTGQSYGTLADKF